MKKIGIIEDDFSYMKLLKEALHFNPQYHCLIATNSIEDFWAQLPPRLTLDIILLDLSLPGLNGIEGLPQIKTRFPTTEIVILTQLQDENALFKALSLGASGYLVKDFPINQLNEYLNILQNGGALISPSMARYLVNYFAPSTQSHSSLLNSKEEQILNYFSNGLSYEEVADFMNLSINGVRYYVKTIYKKLNVNTKIDAIRIFKESNP